MKKRILSLVLATLMIISVLPAHALADDNPLTTYAAAAEPTKTVSAASTDGSVHVNKSISEDEKTLTLEAFATNTVSTETTYDPLDIVLVLDVSGSMRDCINCDATYDYYSDYGWYWSNNSEYCNDRPQYTYEKKGFAKNLTEKDAPLYKANTDGSYSEVEWCNGQHMLWTHQPGWYENGFISHSRVNDNTILYKQVKAEQIKHQHRIDALKTAVGDFIDSVAAQKDSKGKTIANKISIVKFASDLNEAIGDDKDTDGYNYSQIVKGLTDVNTGSEDLKNAVNELTAAGATSADYGMQLAASVLDKRKTDDPSTKLSKSVVILFTDGEPNHENSFDDKVASNAISAAKALKDGGTSVFTVGVFKGANPDTDVSTADKTNKYMHAVSSNYPSAAYTKSESGWEESWNWNFGTGAENSNYYLAASNAAQLDDVFQAISKEVSSLTAKVDAASVLSDTLSGAFDFNAPENAEYSGITVAKYPVTGMENGAYTWGTAENLPIGEGEGKVQVEMNGKKLEVTGFDYGANAVTTKTEGDKTTYSGYKLVVTIPIKPDTTYTGWQQGEHYYDTNSIAEGSEAGLSYGNNGSQKLELTDSPEAPVTAYTVTYTDGVDGEEIFADQTSTVLPDTATPAFNGTPSRDGYEFNGWTPAVAETVTGNATYTAQWKQLTYTVTYTDGVDGEEVFKDQVTENLKSGDKTPAFDGTPSRDGYEFNGWTPAVAETVTGNATYTAQWKQLTYTVTYTDGVDGEEVFKDQVTENLKSGDKTPAFDGTPSRDGYEFNGWSPAVAETVTENATYTATWTEKQDPPAVKYKVIYRFESGTTGKDLPQEVTDLLPTDNTEYATGDTVTPETLSTTEVSVSDGKWEFKGWNPNGEQTFEKSDITFTGTWEFTSTVLPPEQKYGVLVQVEKDVRSDRGTYDGGEWFTFDISSDEDGVNKLGDLSVYFGETVYEGQTRDTLGSVILDLTKEQYDGLIAESFGGTEYKVIYLTEKRGSTEGMSYETQPVKLYLKNYQPEAIAYSTITYAKKYEAYVNPAEKEWAVVTNVYNKPTDRDVTPAKVSPQLNRDDHVAYIMGYPDGKVRPEGEITRAEACTIFFRLLTEESRDYYFTKTNDYTDVSRSDWFNNAISTLSNAGIVTGYADGTFRPDQPITRGEMAKIIANFARLGGATKSFTDLSGHWAKTYVELAAGNGWIEGYPDGTFGPDKKITRAETVTMINRVLDRVPAKESRLLPRSVMLTFPDNEPGEWYYIAIQEATNSHTYQRSVYETAGDEMWIKLIDNVDWTKLEK